MRAAVALLVTLTMSTAACFPHNEQHRTYAKLGEGGALVAGIILSGIANTGADCDEKRAPGTELKDCHSNANILSTVGVTLILAGLLGFVATVSTAEDEDKTSTKVLTPTPTPTPVPANTTNTQATAPATGSGSDAGSAATP